MPRRARLWQWTEAACYHVINRGHARETVFHDDDDRQRFLQLLAQYRDRFELRIYHYCLMGNHFHILLQLPDPKGLSRMMAGLLVAYWHHYRRRYGLVGHLFQGRFKSPAVARREDWVIGGEAFRKKMRRPATRPAPRHRGRPLGVIGPAAGGINS